MRDELNDLMRAEHRAAANHDHYGQRRIAGTWFEDTQVPDARDLAEAYSGRDDWGDE